MAPLADLEPGPGSGRVARRACVGRYTSLSRVDNNGNDGWGGCLCIIIYL